MSLDQRTIEKVNGQAWKPIRQLFDSITADLLSVSESSRGELTTIYVKFISAETHPQPFAVIWLRSSSKLTIGLSLPEEYEHEIFCDTPRGCKYAGLTKYMVLNIGDSKPLDFNKLAVEAFLHAVS